MLRLKINLNLISKFQQVCIKIEIIEWFNINCKCFVKYFTNVELLVSFSENINKRS